jgi:hypothetical protein
MSQMCKELTITYLKYNQESDAVFFKLVHACEM